MHLGIRSALRIISALVCPSVFSWPGLVLPFCYSVVISSVTADKSKRKAMRTTNGSLSAKGPVTSQCRGRIVEPIGYNTVRVMVWDEFEDSERIIGANSRQDSRSEG